MTPDVPGASRLVVSDLSAGYGEAVILRGVSLEVGAGEIVALVGSSGAGKTTLLRTLVGLLPVRQGTVRAGGLRVDGLAPYRIAAHGVIALPEGRRLFDELSVRENLAMGAYLPGARARAADSLARIEALFPVLRTKADTLAGRLSGGEQQMVALGRALMARPRWLLLDDPFLGLAPPVRAQVAVALRELAEVQRVAVLAAGQHVRTLLRVAHRTYVLDEGRLVAAGAGVEMARHPRVREVLLEPAGGEPA